MHAYPLPNAADDYDLEEDATIIQPSPYLALMAAMDEAVTNPAAAALPETPTQHAMGYPSAPVQHTFTEPLRGYPQAAAFVPRHEETGVMPKVEIPQQSVGLPQTIGMPAVVHAAPAAPQYGQNVVALPAVAPEAAQPLVVDGGSIAYAAHASRMAHPAPAPSYPAPAEVAEAAARDTEVPQQLRGGRALFGALLGAIAGALLWGAVGYLTGGWEFKYGAVLIGLFTGVGASRLGGGHSKAVGALGAVFGLAGILTGKALFEILVQPHLTLGEHIAYHATPIDLIFYGATVVTGFAVGAGALSPRTIFSRGRRVLRHYIPAIG